MAETRYSLIGFCSIGVENLGSAGAGRTLAPRLAGESPGWGLSIPSRADLFAFDCVARSAPSPSIAPPPRRPRAVERTYIHTYHQVKS